MAGVSQYANISCPKIEMRRVFKYVKLVVGAVMMLAAFSILGWIKWGHIDMTELRKTIEFWPQILLATCLLVFGYMLCLMGDRQ